MLIGFAGFSQSQKQSDQGVTVTLTNGEESIVITQGKQANLLKLTSNNQTDRFEGLELSNHEVVHQRELPGMTPGLDSLAEGHSHYSFYSEEEPDPEEAEGGSDA